MKNIQYEELWNEVREVLRGAVGESVYDLWFQPVRLLHIKDGSATLEVPNRFYKEWIEDYHPTLIAEALEKVGGARLDLKFKVLVEEDADIRRQDARLENRKTKLARKGIYLNPRYVFGTFVVGSSNSFAHAAAQAIAEKPGKMYNPFFVYGGVGLGKTHLITAIGNKIIDKAKDMNVLYVSAEQFTNEVVSAIRHGKTDDLKAKYRNLDMIIIDDVQYVERKHATQEELFHTLNVLYEGQKQIVLSSDRPPKDIKEITDRLRSRFNMGLIADIQIPEMETKIAIIHKKAEADKLVIPDDVVDYIASRIKSNIRDLEGCLIRLGAHSSLTGKPVTLDMARTLLRDFIPEDDLKPVSVEGIMKIVAEYFGIRVQDIKARRKTKDIALPRQIAMFISRELTPCSLNEIGKHMGGKDHATVIYAARQIDKKRREDEQFGRMIDQLINKIRP
jgi:chromosomal replication initiator protein